MNNEKKNIIVPEFRFPEFKDSWVYLNGDKLFEQISDKNHNSDLPILAITQEYGAIPRDKIDYNVSVTDKSIESYKVVQVGDFIISLRSFQGGIEYSDYKGLCSPAYIILRRKNDKDVVNEFFKHYFKTKAFICDLNRNLEGIRDGKMVSYKQFSDIKIPFPGPNEQQKIASCLSSLDDLITADTKKLDALKAHKKGLMQQLFPAEGEKVPKRRFAEFKDSGEWEEKKLGEIAENLDYKRIPITENGRVKGHIPYYGASGIIDYVQEYLFDESLLCISEDGANLVARNYPIAFSISGKTWVNNHAHVLRFNKPFTQSIVESYLNSISLEDFLTGMAQPKLNQAKLDIIPIPLPKSEGEQQKIAFSLSSLDELIAAQAEKIEQLKMHKKGLMQGLFPIVNK